MLFNIVDTSKLTNNKNNLLIDNLDINIPENFIKKLFNLTSNDISLLNSIKDFIHNNTNYHISHSIYIDSIELINILKDENLINLYSSNHLLYEIIRDNNDKYSIYISISVILFNEELNVWELHEIYMNHICQLVNFFQKYMNIIHKEIYKIYMNYINKKYH